MVMSYNPKNPPPEPPHYEGPTTAELFCDDMACQRALVRQLGSTLPTFETEAIRARYFVGARIDDSVKRGDRIVFMDGSAAKRRNNRWVVN